MESFPQRRRASSIICCRFRSASSAFWRSTYVSVAMGKESHRYIWFAPWKDIFLFHTVHWETYMQYLKLSRWSIHVHSISYERHLCDMYPNCCTWTCLHWTCGTCWPHRNTILFLEHAVSHLGATLHDPIQNIPAQGLSSLFSSNKFQLYNLLTCCFGFGIYSGAPMCSKLFFCFNVIQVQIYDHHNPQTLVFS